MFVFVLLLLSGCKKYGPVTFAGAVVETYCIPSQLGNGDRFYITLKNVNGASKTLVYYWPDSTKLCYNPDLRPKPGTVMSATIVNQFINGQKENVWHVPGWAVVK